MEYFNIHQSLFETIEEISIDNNDVFDRKQPLWLYAVQFMIGGCGGGWGWWDGGGGIDIDSHGVGTTSCLMEYRPRNL